MADKDTDAPTFIEVQCKMLLPALWHLRGFGIVSDRDDSDAMPVGTTPSEADAHLQDLGNNFTAGYVSCLAYADLNGNFVRGSQKRFDELRLHHWMYRKPHYCLVRSVMEDAGFVVDWEDVDHKPLYYEDHAEPPDPSSDYLANAHLVLRLADGDEPYDLEDNGYEPIDEEDVYFDDEDEEERTDDDE